MEAANKGARLAGGYSIGLNISIPFEQFVNNYVTPDLSFEFHYFFMRKFWFAYLSKALIVFPGGFGTMDEFFEIITLIQTGKIKKNLLLVVYDKKYWSKIINFNGLVERGVISKSDLSLFSMCNTVDEAFDIITTHFKKNYLNAKEKENRCPKFRFKIKMPLVKRQKNYFMISTRCARRRAFNFSIRFFTEGFTKNVRFLNSLRTPDLSYFFLKLLKALSMDSFSPTDIPTKKIHLAFGYFS